MTPAPFRIRTVTAGVTLANLDDLAPIESAIRLLGRARTHFTAAGFELQTVRIATQPVLAGMDAAAREKSLGALEAFDKLAVAHQVSTSIGPVMTDNRNDPDLADWSRELVQRTQSLSFSVRVACAERGVHRNACKAAASVMHALASAIPGGVGNFRFAAAALIPPGTPFFPVGFHEGGASIAIGVESAGLVEAAISGAGNAEEAEQQLRQTLNEQLAVLERLGADFAASESVRFLGIDPSPAPGLDRSIGAAIESFTRVPFGSPSTLTACAAITSALKSLSVRTCGYAGLMLPVLEDPVLAERAKEGRYGIEELLLFSSVCGTGLDVVPIPGSTPMESMARLIGDVAALATKLRKPLSARLFPVPGAKPGDLVRFDDPWLTETVVFPID